MSARLGRLLLLALLAVWMILAWPHLAEQWRNTGQARADLADLSWEERAAALDPPGYAVAQQIAQAVAPSGCVLVLAHTGPEHVNYYRARFAYYLYPRRVRFADRTDAALDGCAHLAVFRDTPANLAQEPFRGRWDETEIAARAAAMTRILAGPNVEVFRAP